MAGKLSTHRIRMITIAALRLGIAMQLLIVLLGVSALAQSEKISGSGQRVTKKFYLPAGLTFIEMTHSGLRNFAMTLMDANGEYVDLLVNRIGRFTGSKAISIESAGQYLIDVDADGSWTASIFQPQQAVAMDSSKYSGSGQHALGLVWLTKGLKVFDLKHSARRKGNFSVLLLDRFGGYVDLLVNEIGDFEGSTAVKIPESGCYAFDIDAVGNWSIRIE